MKFNENIVKLMRNTKPLSVNSSSVFLQCFDENDELPHLALLADDLDWLASDLDLDLDPVSGVDKVDSADDDLAYLSSPHGLFYW